MREGQRGQPAEGLPQDGSRQDPGVGVEDHEVPRSEDQVRQQQDAHCDPHGRQSPRIDPEATGYKAAKPIRNDPQNRRAS